MSKKDWQTALSLDGRFLGFVFDGYKIKRLRLMTADGECSVKLAKEVRTSLREDLAPGTWIQVWGTQKTSYKTQTITLKADRVSIASPGQPQIDLPAAPQKPAHATMPAHTTMPAHATILVCQKSDCMKRGGKAVCHALEAALSDRALADRVKIKGTGCMKQCKAGPNIVLMPGKTRYSRVAAQDMGMLVDEHFPCEMQAEASHPDHSSVR